MTRIDFYILKESSELSRLDLFCKLAEKACGQFRSVYIYGSKRAHLVTLDELLWSFRPISFVAHKLLPENHIISSVDDDPVLLCSTEPGSKCQILMNLDTSVPPFFSRFERTIEVINSQPAVQAAGRERYRFYKQRGYPLHHHEL